MIPLILKEPGITNLKSMLIERIVPRINSFCIIITQRQEPERHIRLIYTTTKGTRELTWNKFNLVIPGPIHPKETTIGDMLHGETILTMRMMQAWHGLSNSTTNPPRHLENINTATFAQSVEDANLEDKTSYTLEKEMPRTITSTTDASYEGYVGEIKETDTEGRTRITNTSGLFKETTETDQVNAEDPEAPPTEEEISNKPISLEEEIEEHVIEIQQPTIEQLNAEGLETLPKETKNKATTKTPEGSPCKKPRGPALPNPTHKHVNKKRMRNCTEEVIHLSIATINEINNRTRIAYIKEEFERSFKPILKATEESTNHTTFKVWSCIEQVTIMLNTIQSNTDIITTCDQAQKSQTNEPLYKSSPLYMQPSELTIFDQNIHDKKDRTNNKGYKPTWTNIKLSIEKCMERGTWPYSMTRDGQPSFSVYGGENTIQLCLRIAYQLDNWPSHMTQDIIEFIKYNATCTRGTKQDPDNLKPTLPTSSMEEATQRRDGLNNQTSATKGKLFEVTSLTTLITNPPSTFRSKVNALGHEPMTKAPEVGFNSDHPPGSQAPPQPEGRERTKYPGVCHNETYRGLWDIVPVGDGKKLSQEGGGVVGSSQKNQQWRIPDSSMEEATRHRDKDNEQVTDESRNNWETLVTCNKQHSIWPGLTDELKQTILSETGLFKGTSQRVKSWMLGRIRPSVDSFCLMTTQQDLETQDMHARIIHTDSTQTREIIWDNQNKMTHGESFSNQVPLGDMYPDEIILAVRMIQTLEQEHQPIDGQRVTSDTSYQCKGKEITTNNVIELSMQELNAKTLTVRQESKGNPWDNEINRPWNCIEGTSIMFSMILYQSDRMIALDQLQTVTGYNGQYSTKDCDREDHIIHMSHSQHDSAIIRYHARPPYCEWFGISYFLSMRHPPKGTNPEIIQQCLRTMHKQNKGHQIQTDDIENLEVHYYSIPSEPWSTGHLSACIQRELGTQFLIFSETYTKGLETAHKESPFQQRQAQQEECVIEPPEAMEWREMGFFTCSSRAKHKDFSELKPLLTAPDPLAEACMNPMEDKDIVGVPWYGAQIFHLAFIPRIFSEAILSVHNKTLHNEYITVEERIAQEFVNSLIRTPWIDEHHSDVMPELTNTEWAQMITPDGKPTLHTTFQPEGSTRASLPRIEITQLFNIKSMPKERAVTYLRRMFEQSNIMADLMINNQEYGWTYVTNIQIDGLMSKTPKQRLAILIQAYALIASSTLHKQHQTVMERHNMENHVEGSKQKIASHLNREYSTSQQLAPLSAFESIGYWEDSINSTFMHNPTQIITRLQQHCTKNSATHTNIVWSCIMCPVHTTDPIPPGHDATPIKEENEHPNKVFTNIVKDILNLTNKEGFNHMLQQAMCVQYMLTEFTLDNLKDITTTNENLTITEYIEQAGPAIILKYQKSIRPSEPAETLMNNLISSNLSTDKDIETFTQLAVHMIPTVSTKALLNEWYKLLSEKPTQPAQRLLGLVTEVGLRTPDVVAIIGESVQGIKGEAWKHVTNELSDKQLQNIAATILEVFESDSGREAYTRASKKPQQIATNLIIKNVTRAYNGGFLPTRNEKGYDLQKSVLEEMEPGKCLHGAVTEWGKSLQQRIKSILVHTDMFSLVSSRNSPSPVSSIQYTPPVQQHTLTSTPAAEKQTLAEIRDNIKTLELQLLQHEARQSETLLHHHDIPAAPIPIPSNKGRTTQGDITRRPSPRTAQMQTGYPHHPARNLEWENRDTRSRITNREYRPPPPPSHTRPVPEQQDRIENSPQSRSYTKSDHMWPGTGPSWAHGNDAYMAEHPQTTPYQNDISRDRRESQTTQSDISQGQPPLAARNNERFEKRYSSSDEFSGDDARFEHYQMGERFRETNTRRDYRCNIYNHRHVKGITHVTYEQVIKPLKEAINTILKRNTLTHKMMLLQYLYTIGNNTIFRSIDSFAIRHIMTIEAMVEILKALRNEDAGRNGEKMTTFLELTEKIAEAIKYSIKSQTFEDGGLYANGIQMTSNGQIPIAWKIQRDKISQKIRINIDAPSDFRKLEYDAICAQTWNNDGQSITSFLNLILEESDSEFTVEDYIHFIAKGINFKLKDTNGQDKESIVGMMTEDTYRALDQQIRWRTMGKTAKNRIWLEKVMSRLASEHGTRARFPSRQGDIYSIDAREPGIGDGFGGGDGNTEEDELCQHIQPEEGVPDGQIFLFNDENRQTHECEACGRKGHIESNCWQITRKSGEPARSNINLGVRKLQTSWAFRRHICSTTRPITSFTPDEVRQLYDTGILPSQWKAIQTYPDTSGGQSIEVKIDSAEAKKGWEYIQKGMNKAPQLYDSIPSDHFKSLKCNGNCKIIQGRDAAGAIECPIWSRKGRMNAAVMASTDNLTNGSKGSERLKDFNQATLNHLADQVPDLETHI